ncbi:MAG TPA: hypothetical protein VJ888_09490 [Mobilitalea sp.]|nr:hypothetical protein [Mobilitalea sp.]
MYNNLMCLKHCSVASKKTLGYRKNQLVRICLLVVLLLLIAVIGSSCQRKGSDRTEGQMIILHPGYSITEEGVLYTDSKTFARQCYFDFGTMKNVYFCSKPNCNHTSLECTARVVRDYHFFIGDDRFYLESRIEMDDNKQEIRKTYLYQSDMSNTRTKAVAKFNGIPTGNHYLIANQLYLFTLEYEIEDGVSTSYSTFCLNVVDLKTFSVQRIPIRDGDYLGMLLSGIVDQQLILYYRYYDDEVDAKDYGMTGSFEEFTKDTVKYQEYLQAVMEVFHDGMCRFDLNSHQLEELELPVPLLVSDEYYYYNKQKANGTYELTALNYLTKEEGVLLDAPAYSVSKVKDTLFILEGCETISDITGQPYIGRDSSGREYVYDIVTKELKGIEDTLPEDASLRLITEYGDYYIFLYTNNKEGISQRIGYILKEDYLNGKINYTIVDPI